MKKERKKEGKKGKNCGLAFAVVIVILLVAMMQNLSLHAKAPEETNLPGLSEMLQEEETAETETTPEEEAITAAEETAETETTPEEEAITAAEETAETETTPEEEAITAAGETAETETITAAEETAETEEAAEEEQTEDNDTDAEQDDMETWEESISDNVIILKMIDGNQVVQEEKITSGSISCNLISLQKTGFIFDGYLYGDLRVLDADGIFTTEYTQLLEMELPGNVLELKPLWIPKTYRVYYGKDENRDGLPDGHMLVTYGESYENLTPLPDRGLSVFKGYYFGSKQVFNRKGKAKESWLFDSDEDIILKAKYYRPEGNDLFGDHDASSRESEEYNIPQSTDTGDSQNKQDLPEHESSESLDLNSNAAENTANHVSDNAIHNAQVQDKADGTVSDNQRRTGENALLLQAGDGETPNASSPNASGNNMENISQNSTGNNTKNKGNILGSGLQNSTGNNTKNKGNILGSGLQNSAGNDTKNSKETTQNITETAQDNAENVKNNADNTQNHAEKNAANEKETVQSDTEEKRMEPDKKKTVNPGLLWENYRRWRANAVSYPEENGIPKEVLKISAYAVTCSILLAALLLGFYLMRNSAVLCTNNFKGKRKRIAFILLQKTQEGYQLSITKKQLDESETGNYVLILPRHVVRSKKNDRLIISIPNKKWCELPAKEISFLA